MRAPPVPGNEALGLDALREAYCAYAPREERFDRITRTAKRLLHVPIALISIIEQGEQWFRSVQGLEVAHTPRDISFGGFVVGLKQPFCIPDTLTNPDFADNPLVTGPPGNRSYLGWPLEIAPGVAVGSLCVIDTMPRTFGQDDFDALRDLAGMAETELKVSASANLQNKLLMRLNALQRQGALDPLTGCWNIRGFRELLAMGFEEARAHGTDLAVCNLHVNNLQEVADAADCANLDAVTILLAQVLRQRLPPQCALARLGPLDFCALIPSASPLDLEQELAKLTFPSATVDLPKSQLKIELSLTVQVAWLADWHFLQPCSGDAKCGPSSVFLAFWPPCSWSVCWSKSNCVHRRRQRHRCSGQLQSIRRSHQRLHRPAPALKCKASSYSSKSGSPLNAPCSRPAPWPMTNNSVKYAVCAISVSVSSYQNSSIHA